MLLHAHTLAAEAVPWYTQAEQLNPAEPHWPYLHAQVVGDDPPRALALLRRAVGLAEQMTDTPDAPYLKVADACLEQGLLDEAVLAYGRLLQRRPEHPRAHLGLARVEVRRGRPGEALPHLKGCCKHRATQKNAQALLAEVYRRRGDAAAAASACKEAANLPEDAPWPDPWLDELQGMLVGFRPRMARMQDLQRQGRLREAAELAQKTAEDYPDIGLFARGRMLLGKGLPEQAETAIRQGLSLNPDLVEGLVDLGTALQQQKRFAAAADAFRRATELEPAYAEAYLGWARCAQALGDKPQALHLLRQAVQYLPHRGDVHRDLGSLLIGEGRRHDALHHLEQAVRLSPEDGQARTLLAEARGKK
jgi:tetratricopeptide (TPR) repeat protein